MKRVSDMKIAAITDDGITISQHFGRAPYYIVLTIENNEIAKREMRDKPSHHQFAHQQCEPNDRERRGFGPSSQAKHAAMANGIADCDALLCQGMGWGAHESMKEHGIPVVVTDIANVEAAIQSYLNGIMVDRPRGCPYQTARMERRCHECQDSVEDAGEVSVEATGRARASGEALA